MQRHYPWLVIGIAFLTVGVAFGTRNVFAVFCWLWSKSSAGAAASQATFLSNWFIRKRGMAIGTVASGSRGVPDNLYAPAL